MWSQKRPSMQPFPSATTPFLNLFFDIQISSKILLINFIKFGSCSIPDHTIRRANCRGGQSRSLEVRSEDIDHHFVLRLAARDIWWYYNPPTTAAPLKPLNDAAFWLFKLQLVGIHHELAFHSAIFLNAAGTLNLKDIFEAKKNVFSRDAIKRSYIHPGMSQPIDPARLDEAKIFAPVCANFRHSKTKLHGSIGAASKASTPEICSNQSRACPESAKVGVKKDVLCSATELRIELQHQREIFKKIQEKK